jgi:hypothetical protein
MPNKILPNQIDKNMVIIFDISRELTRETSNGLSRWSSIYEIAKTVVARTICNIASLMKEATKSNATFRKMTSAGHKKPFRLFR